nr:uncharacterized protein LOC109187622 [Ipomoea trifida]GMC77045.1 Protein ORANGE-ORANGE like [Ipomoea batatas]
MFEHITANEIAGYGVGAFLLCSTIYAPKIDSLVAASQRSSLGMCKKCGDLKLIACRKCKGSGFIKQGGGPFNLIFANDDPNSQLVGSKSRITHSSCSNCKARGHFLCPDCPKLPQS